MRLTRRLLIAFGVFAFLWPVLAAFVTDVLSIDIFALLVLASVLTTNSKTIRRFPKIVLILLIYPLVFVLNASTSGLANPTNWLLVRNSPVLAFSLIDAIWAAFGIYMLLKCHSIASRIASGTIVVSHSNIDDEND